MSVLISDEVLQAAQMSDAELKMELSVLLYQQKKLGLSKAKEVAGVTLIEFQQELSRRQIAVFDDLEGLEVEIAKLKMLGDL
jgi:predicted HTH domain antitoxin